MKKSISQAIPIFKPLGLTPAQAIDIFREQNPKYKEVSISHAGKLDPMAEGLLLLVTGNLTKQNNLRRFLGLDKEYKAKILFGFSTDTYDIQGIPKKGKSMEINEQELIKEIEKLKGVHMQKTPAFSGRKVNGRPLYYYARNNKLDTIKIPEQKIIIKKIQASNFSKINNEQLLKEITGKMKKLNGDFRQEEILGEWRNLLKDNEEYYTIDLTIECSSGTYVRAIANELGEKFNSAILLNLIRTKIGEYSVKKSVRLTTSN